MHLNCLKIRHLRPVQRRNANTLFVAAVLYSTTLLLASWAHGASDPLNSQLQAQDLIEQIDNDKTLNCANITPSFRSSLAFCQRAVPKLLQQLREQISTETKLANKLAQRQPASGSISVASAQVNVFGARAEHEAFILTNTASGTLRALAKAYERVGRQGAIDAPSLVTMESVGSYISATEKFLSDVGEGHRLATNERNVAAQQAITDGGTLRPLGTPYISNGDQNKEGDSVSANSVAAFSGSGLIAAGVVGEGYFQITEGDNQAQRQIAQTKNVANRVITNVETKLAAAFSRLQSTLGSLTAIDIGNKTPNEIIEDVVNVDLPSLPSADIDVYRQGVVKIFDVRIKRARSEGDSIGEFKLQEAQRSSLARIDAHLGDVNSVTVRTIMSNPVGDFPIGDVLPLQTSSESYEISGLDPGLGQRITAARAEGKSDVELRAICPQEAASLLGKSVVNLSINERSAIDNRCNQLIGGSSNNASSSTTSWKIPSQSEYSTLVAAK